MKTVYNKKTYGTLSVVEAKTHASFYGIPGCLTYRFNCCPPCVMIVAEFKPDWGMAKYIPYTMIKPIVKINEGAGTSFRIVEQHISIDPVYASILKPVNVVEGGVPEGRDICDNLIQGHEWIMETVRRSIISCIHRDLRDTCTQYLENVYGKETKDTARNIFKDLHWQLILNDANPSQEVMSVVSATMSENRPRYFEMNLGNQDLADRKHDIFSLQIIRELQSQCLREFELTESAIQAEIRRQFLIKEARTANEKASLLVSMVCGPQIFAQFVSRGFIVFSKNGYTFTVEPNKWILCTDPEGSSAQMCIHTVNFSCDPVDELVIAYLNINNNFDEYVSTARFHKIETGFIKPGSFKVNINEL